MESYSEEEFPASRPGLMNKVAPECAPRPEAVGSARRSSVGTQSQFVLLQEGGEMVRSRSGHI